MNKTESVAGISIGGGKKENFYFCLLEFFEEEHRWFLTTLRPVKGEQTLDKDEAIMKWVENYNLKRLVLDFPLTTPVCDICSLECPGVESCHHPVVQKVRQDIKETLEADEKLVAKNPKKYEQQREEMNKENFKEVLRDGELLRKPFKRKLKKGYLPYWNRPIDLWIWKNYYDEILKYFNISYDSFGNVSLMLMHRFKYLMKHLPESLNLFEASVSITLIELLKAKIISLKDIKQLGDIDEAPVARVKIAKAIERELKIFIYSKDLETLAKESKAFDSFLMSLAGHSLILGKNSSIESYDEVKSPNFLAPQFS